MRTTLLLIAGFLAVGSGVSAGALFAIAAIAAAVSLSLPKPV